MRKPTKLALGIGTASIFCFAASFAMALPYQALLLWTAFSCAAVATAYGVNFPGVFGKNEGKLRVVPVILLLPYISTFWFACWLMRTWRRTRPLDEVSPGVYVGGRLRGEDIPGGTALIVDLTCEFTEPAEIRQRPEYRSLPVLDGGVPSDPDAFRKILDESRRTQGAVVFHCDAGRGRAPTAAALALLWRGCARDVDAVIEKVSEARPVASLTFSDREFIRRMYAEFS